MLKSVSSALGLVLVLTLSACGDGSDEADDLQQRVQELEQQLAAATSTTTTTTTPAPTTTARATTTTFTTTPSTTRPPAIDPDAETVLFGLAANGAPVGSFVVYTAATDPNELLGRPGGYTSKVNFADVRLDPEFPADEHAIDDGGSIEVYPDAVGSYDRSEYIQAILGEAPLLGAEYHVLSGRVLVRVSGRLTPDEMEIYERALHATMADLDAGMTYTAADVPAATTTTIAASDPPDPLPAIDGTIIIGSGEPELEAGEPGTVSVIATGNDQRLFVSDALVLVIVRNNTPEPVTGVEVSAVLRNDNGSLAGTGNTLEVVPNEIPPGAIGWGTLLVDDVSLPPGPVPGEYSTTWQDTTDEFRQLPSHASIVEYSENPGNVVAVVENPWLDELTFVEGNLLCLAPDGTPTDSIREFADPIDLPPAGTAGVSVSRPDGCDTWLMTADGNRF